MARSFLRDELGQDTTENLLLVAFVVLVSAAVYMSAGSSVSGIWTTTSSQLAGVNSNTAGSPANPGTSNSGNGSGGDDRGCRGDDGQGHGCH